MKNFLKKVKIAASKSDEVVIKILEFGIHLAEELVSLMHGGLFMVRPIRNKVLHMFSVFAALFLLVSCGEKKEVHPTAAPPSQGQENPEPTNPGNENGGGVEIPTNPGNDVDKDQRDAKIPPDEPSVGYDPGNPSNIDEGRFHKRYTGMKDRQSGLLFTGSSLDSLLSFLRLRSEGKNIDAETRIRNQEAASKVLSARIHRADREITVTLEISEGDAIKTYIFSGRRSGSRVIKLESSQKTGAEKIEAAIKCMNIDGGCENSMLKLLVGEPGTRAVVRILFRDSLADVHVSLPGKRSANPEYENIRNFWVNSILNIETTERMRAVVFSAFEVVNGRSGFEVQIIGENGEAMTYAGPLLAPEKGTKVNLLANTSVEESSSRTYSYNLANSIGSARVINNNGLGQLKLALTMRARAGYDQDTFMLTVMRIVMPLLPLTERSIEM